MFPSWAGSMIARGVILVTLCIALVVGVWIVSGNLQDAEASANPAASEPTHVEVARKVVPAAEKAEVPVEPLPAGPAVKFPLESASSPKQARPITLDEATALLEQSGRGPVMKSSVRGSGMKTQFNFEVEGPKGTKTFLAVNATGTVVTEVLDPDAVKIRKGTREGGTKGKGGKKGR